MEDNDSRQAGAGDEQQLTEEVTPEMISAGVSVLDSVGSSLPETSLVAAIYTAMNACREQ